VTNIVEEGGRDRVAGALAGHPLPERELAVDLAEPGEQESHHVSGPERVRETRVLRARERERGQPELADPPKPLDLARAQEARDDRRLVSLELDQPMDRVAEDHDRASQATAQPAHRAAQQRARREAGRSSLQLNVVPLRIFPI
jgi:hypothetical protein